jgi:hypothetical protein
MGTRRGGVFRRWIELILDKESADRAEKDTQEALDKGTDPKKPVANLKKTGGALEDLGRIARRVGGILAGMFGLRAFVNANIEAQAANAQLEATLRSTGHAAGFNADQLRVMATEMADLSNFSSQQVQGAFSRLLTYTGVQGDMFERASKAALDMATALRIDVASAAERVGNILQYPTESLNSLTRQGFRFTDQQKEQIKVLQDSGDMVGAQTIILKELELAYEGSALAGRNTLGGALEYIKKQFNEVLVVTEESSSGVVDALNWIGDNIKPLKGLFDDMFMLVREGWLNLRVDIKEVQVAWLELRHWLASTLRTPGVARLAAELAVARQDLNRLGVELPELLNELYKPRPEAPPVTALGHMVEEAEKLALVLERVEWILRPDMSKIVAQIGRAVPGAEPAGSILSAGFGFTEREIEGWQLFLIDNLSAVNSAVASTALGMQSAFQSAFSAMMEDGRGFVGFMEEGLRGISAAIIGGIADLAATKVVENSAWALEAVAKGIFLRDPSKFAAAKAFAASAAKWAAVGGVAGAAASAARGGGGGGAVPGRDAVSRQVDRMDRVGPDIVIKIDGVDPSNPRHQQLVGQSARQWQQRTGGTIRMESGR